MMKHKWMIVLSFLLVFVAATLLLMTKRSLQKIPAEKSMEKIKSMDEEKNDAQSAE